MTDKMKGFNKDWQEWFKICGLLFWVVCKVLIAAILLLTWFCIRKGLVIIVIIVVVFYFFPDICGIRLVYR